MTKYPSELNRITVTGITEAEAKSLDRLAELVGASSRSDLIRRMARQANNPNLERVLIEVILEDRKQSARLRPEGGRDSERDS